MAQLTVLTEPVFATEAGGQDPRLIHGWVLTEEAGFPLIHALVSDAVGNMSIVPHSKIQTTVRYDFKNESWYDTYETVQAEMAKADRK